ncbi:antibiotic biosynthesis monooxygenase [Swingsia samuiensis]|uniref:Antibiotic biosynthesis monooxygenase n=2 Tax=Swingsia samuiensis TaxID=1293412 RepID=A0A4Y6UNR4_9PROT|nr:antibiotic biosynthesis monooxygenase [Swingsia samuiensis]
MKALPEHRTKVQELLTKLAADVRAEPGCERFVVYTLENDQNLFHVEESYKDEAAFKAHMGTEHGKTFNQAIKTLVEGGASHVVFLNKVI